MIREDAALAPVLDSLSAAKEVALDTEFHGERTFQPRLMLVQVRADHGPCWLIDPHTVDLVPLVRALEQAPVVLVHGGQMDVQLLHRRAGFAPRTVFDTQIAAGFTGGGYPVRLQELVRRHLGEVLPKTETLSDWSRRPLSPDQVRYAEDDVRVLAPLAASLRAALADRGHEALHAECAAEMYAQTLEPVPAEDAWRGVTGAHLLDEPERAALQALAEWREGRARELDIPRFAVASDAILLDLARRRPRSHEAMRLNRRMPSHLWKRDGDEILARLRGAEHAEAPPPLRRFGRAVAECLQAAARVVEARTGIATELVLDEATIERISSGAAPEGWRARALGEDYLAFLQGGAYIRFPPAIHRHF